MGLLVKEVEHAGLGTVRYTKRSGSRSLRVSVGAKGSVRVTLPFLCRFSTAIEFVEKNRDRIIASIGKIRKREASVCRVNSLTDEELNAIRKRAHESLPLRLKELSGYMNEKFKICDKYGRCMEKPFTFRRVAIKNNRSNWGSCSTAGNINLNMHLVSLPPHLRDFIILHELCHLIYPNHGKEFHSLLDRACAGKEKEFAKELRKYRLG